MFARPMPGAPIDRASPKTLESAADERDFVGNGARRALRKCSTPARNAANASRSRARKLWVSRRRILTDMTILYIVRTAKGLNVAKPACSAASASRRAITALNPRWPMARVALAKNQNELPSRCVRASPRSVTSAADVTMLSRLQLDGEMLERLGQKSASALVPAEVLALRVLHRLQCVRHAVLRRSCLMLSGCALHHLSSNGRPDALLRHRPIAFR